MLAAEVAGRARALVGRAGPRAMVAGLGNYGLRGTRHSVGMEVLDQLARQLAVAEGWRVDKRCCADVALATAHGLELVLLKPRRFMNLNGLSVASAGDTTGSNPASVLCIPMAVVCLAAMEDMETISLSGSARLGSSLGYQRSPAKASSKIMFLGASTQNHLENMRSCFLAAQLHSQHCQLAQLCLNT
ncbi:peptidyl-tRNA hydrolase isoform X3 [Taeniopygia guttata]|uniref:peptidyl-tRNA hydrolase isoform X3 n=1 Tax=Taeniopygia guttata TaxID=59729 RepID=UPI003BB8C902